MNILITSESSCDIPAPLLRQHGIHTVAFSVNFPNRTVADNSIPVEDIFEPHAHDPENQRGES